MAELNTLSIGNRWLELAKTSLVSDANLQGYWKLESDGTDSGPNGYTLTGTGSPTHAAAKFGSGATCVKASKYYSIADASCANLEISGSITVSVWAKPTNVAGGWGSGYLLSKRNSATAGGYYLALSGGNTPLFYCDGLTTPSVTHSMTVTDNNWYHVVGRYNSSTGKLAVFLNGTKVEVSTSGSMGDSNKDFFLGLNSNNTAEGFDGMLDDAAVFNRALTDAEILTLCDKTRQGYWRFESGARTTDSSGSGNTLTEDTTPDYVAGVYGDGAEYDGTSNDCMYDSSLTFTPFKNGGTFSGWIYANSVGEGAANDYGRIFNGGAVLYMSSASGTNYKIRLSQQFGTTSGRWETNGYVIPQNTWTHVAVTYNNQSTSNDPTIYINGLSTAITEIAAPAGSVVDNTTIYFGNNTNASGVRAFDGVQDDYCFFSRVLTAAEIREIYAGGGGAFLYNFV